MKKLSLHRETLLQLTDAEQLRIQGGMMANSNGLCPISNDTSCPSEKPWCKMTSAKCTSV